MKIETDDYMEVKENIGCNTMADIFTIAIKSDFFTFGILEKTEQDEWKVTIERKNKIIYKDSIKL